MYMPTNTLIKYCTDKILNEMGNTVTIAYLVHETEMT